MGQTSDTGTKQQGFVIVQERDRRCQPGMGGECGEEVRMRAGDYFSRVRLSRSTCPSHGVCVPWWGVWQPSPSRR